ncbi:MAG: NADH-quinone oxidoreductase subunit L, partial [Candidatus Marinimicrobia bacterium]|nr:NADH-quinone oxidoreductase subunit L [Candidatus Neomarinimicrobiota bacterium]
MHTLTLYALIILFLPLASFVLQIFFGRLIGPRGVWLSVGAVAITLVLALTMLFSVVLGSPMEHYPELVWFSLGDFSLTLGFQLDNIAVVMLVIVALISGLVHLYSVEYMRGDVRYTRFFGYLGIFTFSMNGIVLAHSLLMMYVFWELVGLSSYLLIGHWFEKDSAADASKKAFLANRVGDIGMFIGIMLLWSVTGSFTFQGLYELVDVEGGNMFAGQMGLLSVAGVLVFMGAVGKSAQFPLHVWLPDAMEGPTPVSALIHAATMVAAGVYLVARTLPIFEASGDALMVVAIVGLITSLGAASIALVATDLKRILAYSTISHLGLMMLSLGAFGYTAAIFHLMAHGFSKALLFLGAGSVSHSTEELDIRNLGGLRRVMPLTALLFSIGALSLGGIPILAGFWSKDEILTAVNDGLHPIFIALTLLTVLLSALYMARAMFVVFFGSLGRGHRQVHDAPPT